MLASDLAKLDKLIKNANKWRGDATEMSISRIVVQFGEDVMNVVMLDWDGVKADWRVSTVATEQRISPIPISPTP
jgi:hypothetical protein